MNRPHQHFNSRRGNNQNRDNIKFDVPFKPEWIKQGANNEMVQFCDKLGKFLETTSSSRLRNIYGEVTRIRLKKFEDSKTDFFLLKPKIAYTIGRLKGNEKKIFKELSTILYQAIDSVDENNPKTFDNFQKFFEAILAYHKFYSKKDNK